MELRNRNLLDAAVQESYLAVPYAFGKLNANAQAAEYYEHAVESFPTLRHLPGTPFPVTFSSIMDARLRLDRLVGSNDDDRPLPPAPAKRPGAWQLSKAVA